MPDTWYWMFSRARYLILDVWICNWWHGYHKNWWLPPMEVATNYFLGGAFFWWPPPKFFATHWWRPPENFATKNFFCHPPPNFSPPNWWRPLENLATQKIFGGRHPIGGNNFGGRHQPLWPLIFLLEAATNGYYATLAAGRFWPFINSGFEVLHAELLFNKLNKWFFFQTTW